MRPSAEQVARLQSRNSSALRRLPNVIGTATGPKITAGRDTGDLAVKVYVERKVPGIADGDAVPREIGRVLTDVVECGPAHALHAARRRPVGGGCSVGHPGSDGGTIAMVCADERTGEPLLLSNHHVLVMAPRTRLRNRVLQPGGGDPAADVVGRLARAVPLRSDRPNRVDAAVARLVPGITFRGGPPGTREAELGMRVRKTGQATGLTRGRILDVNADIVVDVHGRPLRFTGQLVADLAAAPGDSGSLVVAAGGAAVGLLFAGTDTFVLANPIGRVLRSLRVTL